MTAPGRADQPPPLAGLLPFEEGDFHALSEGLCRDAQYDDRRLVARRKLAAVGREATRRLKRDAGLDLLARTSLHRPHAFNGMRVRRLWVYLCRGKAEKARLKRALGAELARDLDAAYRNAYLCAALEAEALEASLRIHADAWYDGQNLKHRAEREGLEGWREVLAPLAGYRIRLADWKGEWACDTVSADGLREILGWWRPGEMGLRVERRWPAPAGAREAALGPEVPRVLVDELVRLAPLYRYAAWSRESDFLFS